MMAFHYYTSLEQWNTAAIAAVNAKVTRYRRSHVVGVPSESYIETAARLTRLPVLATY